MTQRGQTCRRRDRRAHEPFDVELRGDSVCLRVRGEIVRTLTGRDAEDVRAVLDQPALLDRVVARWR